MGIALGKSDGDCSGEIRIPTPTLDDLKVGDTFRYNGYSYHGSVEGYHTETIDDREQLELFIRAYKADNIRDITLISRNTKGVPVV